MIAFFILEMIFTGMAIAINFSLPAIFLPIQSQTRFGNSIEWISRVPATLKAAQELIKSLLPEQYDKKGYRFCVVCSTYAGIKQQWVVVERVGQPHTFLNNQRDLDSDYV